MQKEVLSGLRAGDALLLSGDLYTARDAAHKRLFDLLRKGRKIPIDLRSVILYYTGPTPTPPGRPIGSAGPTTAGRMDSYTPFLLERGLRAMIGKGPRSNEVKDAIKKYGAVYMAAIGGLGAYLGRCVTSCKVVAFRELGPEAIYRLGVKDFPVVVINDGTGGDFYEATLKRWSRAGRIRR